VDDMAKDHYYTLYISIKKDYCNKVREAKKERNIAAILASPNTCKAAWEMSMNNEHRAQPPGPTATASPDAFNEYFAGVADSIIARLPKARTDPVASIDDISHLDTLNSWNKVSGRDIISLVKKFKEAQKTYHNSCFNSYAYSIYNFKDLRFISI
jgi:hypothetical protein